MNLKSLLTLLAATLVLSGCAQRYIESGINNVTYHMSLDRRPVPGSTSGELGVEIQMDGEGGTQGSLWVDGVPYGRVIAGNHVEVTDDAVVLVDGKVREPVRS